MLWRVAVNKAALPVEVSVRKLIPIELFWAGEREIVGVNALDAAGGSDLITPNSCVWLGVGVPPMWISSRLDRLSEHNGLRVPGAHLGNAD